MKMLPAASTFTSLGEFKAADKADETTPKNAAVPLPATVVMTEVLAVIFRMRLLPLSAM